MRSDPPIATGLIAVSSENPASRHVNLPATAVGLVEGLEFNLDAVDTVDAVDEED